MRVESGRHMSLKLPPRHLRIPRRTTMNVLKSKQEDGRTLSTSLSFPAIPLPSCASLPPLLSVSNVFSFSSFLTYPHALLVIFFIIVILSLPHFHPSLSPLSPVIPFCLFYSSLSLLPFGSVPLLSRPPSVFSLPPFFPSSLACYPVSVVHYTGPARMWKLGEF